MAIIMNIIYAYRSFEAFLYLRGGAARAAFFATTLLALVTSRASGQAPPAAPPAERAFRFAPVDDRSLGLWEGEQPVLVYNHGVVLKPGVPDDRARSSYIHPLYGLDGAVLTDDFPRDHFHHRGLFWAWPHVKIGDQDQEYDLWMLKGIATKFERWLAQETWPGGALLGVANGWYVGPKKVMDEHVWVKAHPARDGRRAIDLELELTPLGAPITLAGAEGKSYGGLTLRFAPGEETVINVPTGPTSDDLYINRQPWTDLTRRWPGRAEPSGAAIFVAPDHPDNPPTWLTRHYGVLCLGWPGVTPQTLPAGKAVRLRYRVWIHRGRPDERQLTREYAEYASGTSPPLSTAAPAR
jgi:hypothetical protein